MLKYLFTNHKLFLIVKIILIGLIVNLIVIFNYTWIGSIFSSNYVKENLSEDMIQYRLFIVQNLEGIEISGEEYNQIYQAMKEDSHVNLEYSYFRSNNQTLEMDKDFYIQKYDPGFEAQSYPCVLLPTGMEETMFLGYDVCGSNEKVEEDVYRFASYLQDRHPILLFDDLILDENGYSNFLLSPLLYASLDMEDEEKAEEYIKLYGELIQSEFNKYGVDVSYSTMLQNMETEETRLNYNSNLYMLENQMQNMSYFMIICISLIMLVKISLILNKEFVSISLLLGKTKREIFSNLLAYFCAIDILQAIIMAAYMPLLFEGEDFINFYVVAIVSGVTLIIFDAIISWITVQTINQKAMFEYIRKKEND